MKWKMFFVVFLCLASLVVLGCGSDEEEPEKITAEQPGESLEEKVGELPEIDPKLEEKIANLIVQLNDENAEIRRTAVLKLAEINHPATVPGLMKALSDKEEEIRGIAADALVKIGAPAVPALIRELRRVSNRLSDNKLLVEVFRKIGEPAVPPLIEEFGHKDYDVRNAAEDALVEIGAPAVPELVKALGHEKEKVREHAVYALVEIGQPVVPELIKALSDDNAAVRGLAADVLGEIGQPAKDAVPALKKALGDENEDVRRRAANALKQIEKVNLIGTNPADGGQILEGGTLTLVFDNPPRGVTVNGTPATVRGTTATWRAVGLTPGQWVFLRIEWEDEWGGESFQMRLNVITVNLTGTAPADGANAANGSPLEITFDGMPTSVTVNGTAATVAGKKATWVIAGTPGQALTVNITWARPDGTTGTKTITLNILKVDKQPPKIVKVRIKDGAEIKAGAINVDFQKVNDALAIDIEFDEPIQTANIQIGVKGEPALGWPASVIKATPNIVRLTIKAGAELPAESEIVITSKARDLAGNEANEVFTFMTRIK